jgi:hypothetical protein
MTREPYLIGYARVSKGDDQSNAAQRALDAAGASGCSRRPPAVGGDRPKLLMIGQQARRRRRRSGSLTGCRAA